MCKLKGEPLFPFELDIINIEKDAKEWACNLSRMVKYAIYYLVNIIIRIASFCPPVGHPQEALNIL